MDLELNNIAQRLYQKDLNKCNNEEGYIILHELVKEKAEKVERVVGKKKLYYVSAEFLIGKLLSNNLINLGIYQEVKDALANNGLDLVDIEEIEKEPSLGNGGLGRLAACFIDSIATLGLYGDGVGLNYHFGLFQQYFEDNKQKERPNKWIDANSWLLETKRSFKIDFKDLSVESKMYEIDVLGYTGKKNKLKLFDIPTIDESIVNPDLSFDKSAIEKNLTLFLYPDDSDDAGKKLRLYQQYFLVSSTAQLIIQEAKEKNQDLHHLDKYVTVQINDTHPTLIIPELIRLLLAEGIKMKEAVQIVSRICAYTNHTILAEALEKWPVAYIQEIIPQLYPIIQTLDAIVYERSKNKKVQVIDENDLVHMASLDINFGYSINGVAAIHSEILEEVELKDYYEMYPQKFNNKTNGITFRRWLFACNSELTAFIDSLIGTAYKENAEKLEQLLAYRDDLDVLEALLDIKNVKKEQLISYIENKEGVTLDSDAIFDIQIKRLHEYKRQQMNLLYVIHKYLEIKKGNLPTRPINFIFGAKAAPAYQMAKDIIHLILCLQKLINNDPVAGKYMKVVMVTNYNVSYGEKLFPAADISEQISLATKEASGTGNMKFMLNGALTIGTADGANVEISDLVGSENIYVFGANKEEVLAYNENNAYDPDVFYNKPIIKEAMDFMVGEELGNISDPDALRRVYDELRYNDRFMTLLDLESYIEAKERIFADYEDRIAWARKMLVNIAKAGFFSSDRTIGQYNEDIWKLK